MSGNKPQTILIGIGNQFRRDDGIGIYIVRELKERLSAYKNITADTLECSGEGTDLMSSWEGYQQAYLFDAVMSRDSAGKIHHLQASAQHIPADFFKYSSHAFSLAEAVELARVLDRLPPQLIIYGIEGQDFSSGGGLSPTVLSASHSVVEKVMDLLLTSHKA